MQKPTLLILTFSIFWLFSFSQSSKIDSLEAQFKNHPDDVSTENVFADKGENTKALEFYQKALKIAESSSDKKNTASLLKNIGILYVTWIKFPEALDY